MKMVDENILLRLLKNFRLKNIYQKVYTFQVLIEFLDYLRPNY